MTTKLATAGRRLVWLSAPGLIALIAAAGCTPPHEPFEPLPPISRHEAVGIVNANVDHITVGLKATGPVAGRVRDEQGRRRSFDLDGILLFLPPEKVRFDLKSLGGTQLLLGSNGLEYWYYNKQDSETYVARCYARPDPALEDQLPVRPDELVEALGLSHIPQSTQDRMVVQRIVRDHQQLLFVEYDLDGEPMLEKEYWLQRRHPRLISRVLFRDRDGIVEMDARLGEYAVIPGTKVWAPRDIHVFWPTRDSELRFNVRRWSTEARLAPDGVQFRPPHQLGIQYEHADIEECP